MMVAGIDSSHLRPTLVAHFGCKAYRFPVIVIVNKVDCLLDTMANKEKAKHKLPCPHCIKQLVASCSALSSKPVYDILRLVCYYAI